MLLEIWVAHKFGSVSAGAHRAPTTGRVPALISNRNDMSEIDCCMYCMYVVIAYFVQKSIDEPVDNLLVVS